MASLRRPGRAAGPYFRPGPYLLPELGRAGLPRTDGTPRRWLSAAVWGSLGCRRRDISQFQSRLRSAFP